jgi:hypothetical protein
LKGTGQRSFSFPIVLLQCGPMVQDRHKQPSSRRWRQQFREINGICEH